MRLAFEGEKKNTPNSSKQKKEVPTSSGTFLCKATSVVSCTHDFFSRFGVLCLLNIELSLLF